jgi:hypothetical protein
MKTYGFYVIGYAPHPCDNDQHSILFTLFPLSAVRSGVTVIVEIRIYIYINTPSKLRGVLKYLQPRS